LFLLIDNFLAERGWPSESNKSDYCSVTFLNFLPVNKFGGATKGLLNISEEFVSSIIIF
jgi:hypothetical protein